MDAIRCICFWDCKKRNNFSFFKHFFFGEQPKIISAFCLRAWSVCLYVATKSRFRCFLEYKEPGSRLNNCGMAASGILSVTLVSFSGLQDRSIPGLFLSNQNPIIYTTHQRCVDYKSLKIWYKNKKPKSLFPSFKITFLSILKCV